MIDQISKITNPQDIKIIQKVLNDICHNATGIVYGNTTAVSVDMVPVGKIMVVDDGTNQGAYMRSGDTLVTLFGQGPTGHTGPAGPPGSGNSINYDVKAYGAKGDAVTDDTIAIQAAIDVASGNGGGVVFFPAGKYVITSTLNIYPYITLQGEAGQSIYTPGPVSEIRTQNYGVNQSFTGHMIQGVDVHNVSFKNLAIRGVSIDGLSQGNAINLSRLNNEAIPNIIMEDMFIYEHAEAAVSINVPIVSHFRGCTFYHIAGKGLSFTNFGTSVTLTSCYFQGCTQSGVYSELAYSSFVGCAAEACGIGYEFYNCSSISVVSCGAEGNQYRSASYPGIDFKITGGYGVNLMNCSSSVNVGSPIEERVYIGDSATKTVVSNFRCYGASASTYDLFIHAAAVAPIVENSNFTVISDTGSNLYSIINHNHSVRNGGTLGYLSSLTVGSVNITTGSITLLNTTNLTSSSVWITGTSAVSKDVTTLSASQTNSHLSLRGATTGTKELALGYDTTNNYGYVQARDFGNSYEPLQIQPLGGVINCPHVPTSSSGLNTGDIWCDTTGGLNILKLK